MQSDLPGAATLASFCEGDETDLEFTDELRQILQIIAWTGNYWHDWPILKSLLSFRLKQVLIQYNASHATSGGRQTLLSGETFDELQERLLEGLDFFTDGPPFTLQRLCELLLNPELTYPNIDKASLAFEKLLLVTSTIPICKDPYPFFPPKGDGGCQQTSEVELSKNNADANGATGQTIADDDILDVALNEEKPTIIDKLLTGDGSLLAKSKSSDSVDGSEAPSIDSEKAQYKDHPSIDEDLMDIPLDDQRSVAEV